MKECSYFDAKELKFRYFASLENARHSAGSMRAKSFLYVFGGRGERLKSITQIERHNLKSGSNF